MNNRIIKFRVWDKKTSKWLNPFDWYLTCNLPLEQNSNNNVYIWKEFKTMELVCHDDYIPQQFTGLLDKNGKEIYEGDIFELKMSSNNYVKNLVVFDNGTFVGIKASINNDHISYNFSDGNSCAPIFFKEQEIIGNIFENPELLKL